MAAAAALAALGAAAASSLGAAPVAPVVPGRPSILLVTLDTTRADHLGAYGWRFARTPNLDALAARGVRFERCDASAVLTLPSHASILTGLHPFRHGVRDNAGFALGGSPPTLAAELGRVGYDTGAVVSAVVVRSGTGLGRGFGVYDDDLGAGFEAGTAVAERPAEATTDAALRVLGTLKAPFLLWVHYFDPHDEYRPPPRFASAVGGPTRLYDGEIAHVDEQLGRLFATLPAGTVVAVVGDHGEMLGEHGETTHGLLPFAGSRRVPLLIAGPGLPAGRAVPELVRTVDLAPTLWNLAEVAVPAGLDGSSLLPLLAGRERGPRLSYTEAFHPFFAFGWYPLRAISDGDRLFVQGPEPGLYDLRRDPAERTDLATSRRGEAGGWGARLEAMLRAAGETLLRPVAVGAGPGDEQREQLESLGYLAGAGGEVRPSLGDPRALVAVAEEAHALSRRIAAGGCEEAVTRLEALSREHPASFSIVDMVGVCRLRLEEPARAVDAYRTATRLAPGNAGTWAGLGQALAALGQDAEAESACRQALALDASQARAAVLLSRLLTKRRDPGALGILTRVIDAGGRGGHVYLARGQLMAASGRMHEAETDFREAMRRLPADPVPLEGLARVVYGRGRAREAAILYEQLARLQPSRGEVWKTLGAIYLYELKDRPAAARCFRSALPLERDPAQRADLLSLLADLER